MGREDAVRTVASARRPDEPTPSLGMTPTTEPEQETIDMPSRTHPSPLRRPPSHDVIVVGGGAVGAATAMLLARGALRTVLLGPRRPGPEPPAMPTLSRGSVLQLARWGLLDDVVAAGTPPVKKMTIRFRDEQAVISIKPSQGIDALYAPRRELLDAVLTQAACAAGAEVHDGASVVDLSMDDGRVVGVRALTAARKRIDLRARLVVGADGLGSIVARHTAPAFTRVGRHASAMTYSHWPDVDVDGFHWSLRPNACSGVIPTNGGAYVFANTSPAGAGDGPELLTALVADGTLELADRLRGVTPDPRTRTWSGRPGFVRRAHGPGWALVGDAGCYRDPISAHGMTDALRDAELLADAVMRGFDNGATLDDATLDHATLDHALAEYQVSRDRLGLPLFDIVDRMASHQWDEAEIAHLVLRLSSAMADEVEALAALGARS